MSRQQRRSQRAVFDLAAAEDIAPADPHHPLHQRTQHRVHELEQFTSFPDQMVVDFRAQGDADFDVYRVNHPARALERPDFVQKVEAVFRGPGDSAENMVLVFLALADDERFRQRFEETVRVHLGRRHVHAPPGDGP